MTTILKSDGIYTGPDIAVDVLFDAYVERVLEDGGEIIDRDAVHAAFDYAHGAGLNGLTVFSATSAAWGIKRNGGAIEKMFSLFDPDGDLIVNSGAVQFSINNGFPGAYSTSAANGLKSVGTTTETDLALAAVTRVTPGGRFFGAFCVADTAQTVVRLGTGIQSSVHRNYAQQRPNAAVALYAGEYEEYSATALHVHDNFLEMYQNGEVIGSSTEVSPYSATSRLYVVGPQNATGGALGGWLFEFWALTGASPSDVADLCAAMALRYGQVSS